MTDERREGAVKPVRRVTRRATIRPYEPPAEPDDDGSRCSDSAPGQVAS